MRYLSCLDLSITDIMQALQVTSGTLNGSCDYDCIFMFSEFFFVIFVIKKF